MRDESRLPLWLIPAGYVVATVAAGEILPRLEHTYWAALSSGMRSEAALAFFSSVSSGMMALTGIVFAMELTHDYNALLPLMVASFMACGVTALLLKRPSSPRS